MGCLSSKPADPPPSRGIPADTREDRAPARQPEPARPVAPAAADTPPPPPPQPGGGPAVSPITVESTRKMITFINHAESMDWPGPESPKWQHTSVQTSGAYSFTKMGEKVECEGTVASGLAKLKSNPAKYLACMYQSDMVDWPTDQQRYTLIEREGTEGLKYKDGDVFTVEFANYQALPHVTRVDIESVDDGVTMQMTHRGALIHGPSNAPICPGRGMGILDRPGIKIIENVDPGDIHQGGVGDCWLLSAISALAEFDGAVFELFKNTPDMHEMPRPGPNRYHVTLYDLKTWRPVDVVVDERLAANPKNPGSLFGAKPSMDGELWACYLEKAFVAHCGGWDHIEGGVPPRAWAMLTGCKDQYTITEEASGKDTGKWTCWGNYNKQRDFYNELENSSKGKQPPMWQQDWPAVGGGGEGAIVGEELFRKIVAWDQEDFIIGCASGGQFDSVKHDGIVDGHAYTVLQAFSDVAGSGVDLVQVRNPWGTGEFEKGMWTDINGLASGWQKFPKVKAQLKPKVAEDGLFWMSKEEFYKYFKTVYVCAKSMKVYKVD